MTAAKKAAGSDGTVERLSLHSLRHSFLSFAATNLQLSATTLAEIGGHADPATTFRQHAMLAIRRPWSRMCCSEWRTRRLRPDYFLTMPFSMWEKGHRLRRVS